MSKKKELILTLGGFTVTRDTGGEHDWVCLRALDGGWTLRFRDDNAMYGKVLLMATNEEYHSLLRPFVNMNYMLSNTLPDGPFVKDFFTAFGAYMGRMADALKDPAPEDWEAQTEAAETIAAMQSELSGMILAEEEAPAGDTEDERNG